jgi:hypothetical protein
MIGNASTPQVFISVGILFGLYALLPDSVRRKLLRIQRVQVQSPNSIRLMSRARIVIGSASLLLFLLGLVYWLRG